MVKISQSALVQQSGNDIYFIIEGPCDGYFTEKVSQAPRKCPHPRLIQ